MSKDYANQMQIGREDFERVTHLILLRLKNSGDSECSQVSK